MLPLHTVEVRWFFLGALPAAVRAWFDGLGDPVEGVSRTDRYLAPASDALGVKLREGQVEAKRRSAVVGPLAAGRAGATAEEWVKWSFPLAEDADPGAGWLEVAKTRWQRRLEAAGGACTLELSTVAVAGWAWWSVCLEAEGPDAPSRRAALGVGAHRWLTSEAAPALAREAARGYPAWLREASDINPT